MHRRLINNPQLYYFMKENIHDSRTNTDPLFTEHLHCSRHSLSEMRTQIPARQSCLVRTESSTGFRILSELFLINCGNSSGPFSAQELSFSAHEIKMHHRVPGFPLLPVRNTLSNSSSPIHTSFPRLFSDSHIVHVPSDLLLFQISSGRVERAHLGTRMNCVKILVLPVNL